MQDKNVFLNIYCIIEDYFINLIKFQSVSCLMLIQYNKYNLNDKKESTFTATIKKKIIIKEHLKCLFLGGRMYN